MLKGKRIYSAVSNTAAIQKLNFDKMYLHRLYKFSKPAFLMIVLCAVVQLFINLKQGITATPFLHFGMYAATFSMPRFVDVWEFEVNGSRLDFSDLPAYKTDYIVEPVNRYYQNRQGNDVYTSTIGRLLSKAYVPHSPAAFNVNISKQAFYNWYLNRVSSLLGKRVATIKVYKTHYLLSGSELQQQQSKLIYDID